MAVLIRQLRLVVLFLLATMVPLISSAAEEILLHEQEIKVGLLYSFLKYTEWPTRQSPLTVCVFGADPFDGYLKPIAHRSVNQTEIVLRFIHTYEEADACSLLFVNADEKKQWPELKKYLDKKSVLTISDFRGFATSGGMIEFGKKEEHISADLNMDAVTVAHLRVQDRLLRLVNVVHFSEAGGKR